MKGYADHMRDILCEANDYKGNEWFVRYQDSDADVCYWRRNPSLDGANLYGKHIPYDKRSMSVMRALRRSDMFEHIPVPRQSHTYMLKREFRYFKYECEYCHREASFPWHCRKQDTGMRCMGCHRVAIYRCVE